MNTQPTCFVPNPFNSELPPIELRSKDEINTLLTSWYGLSADVHRNLFSMFQHMGITSIDEIFRIMNTPELYEHYIHLFKRRSEDASNYLVNIPSIRDAAFDHTFSFRDLTFDIDMFIVYMRFRQSIKHGITELHRLQHYNPWTTGDESDSSSDEST